MFDVSDTQSKVPQPDKNQINMIIVIRIILFISITQQYLWQSYTLLSHQNLTPQKTTSQQIISLSLPRPSCFSLKVWTGYFYQISPKSAISFSQISKIRLRRTIRCKFTLSKVEGRYDSRDTNLVSLKRSCGGQAACPDLSGKATLCDKSSLWK